MEAYDYNSDGTTDLIIVGTDHKGEDNVLIFHYETGDELPLPHQLFRGKRDTDRQCLLS